MALCVSFIFCSSVAFNYIIYVVDAKNFTECHPPCSAGLICDEATSECVNCKHYCKQKISMNCETMCPDYNMTHILRDRPASTTQIIPTENTRYEQIFGLLFVCVIISFAMTICVLVVCSFMILIRWTKRCKSLSKNVTTKSNISSVTENVPLIPCDQNNETAINQDQRAENNVKHKKKRSIDPANRNTKLCEQKFVQTTQSMQNVNSVTPCVERSCGEESTNDKISDKITRSAAVNDIRSNTDRGPVESIVVAIHDTTKSFADYKTTHLAEVNDLSPSDCAPMELTQINIYNRKMSFADDRNGDQTQGKATPLATVKGLSHTDCTPAEPTQSNIYGRKMSFVDDRNGDKTQDETTYFAADLTNTYNASVPSNNIATHTTERDLSNYRNNDKIDADEILHSSAVVKGVSNTEHVPVESKSLGIINSSHPPQHQSLNQCSSNLRWQSSGARCKENTSAYSCLTNKKDVLSSSKAYSIPIQEHAICHMQCSLTHSYCKLTERELGNGKNKPREDDETILKEKVPLAVTTASAKDFRALSDSSRTQEFQIISRDLSGVHHPTHYSGEASTKQLNDDQTILKPRHAIDSGIHTLSASNQSGGAFPNDTIFIQQNSSDPQFCSILSDERDGCQSNSNILTAPLSENESRSIILPYVAEYPLVPLSIPLLSNENNAVTLRSARMETPPPSMPIERDYYYSSNIDIHADEYNEIVQPVVDDIGVGDHHGLYDNNDLFNGVMYAQNAEAESHDGDNQLEGAVGGAEDGYNDVMNAIDENERDHLIPAEVSYIGRSITDDSGAVSIYNPDYQDRSGFHLQHQNNNPIYDHLQNIPWVLGYHSQGRSISVFADLNVRDADELHQELVDITHQPWNKFRIKPNH